MKMFQISRPCAKKPLKSEGGGTSSPPPPGDGAMVPPPVPSPLPSPPSPSPPPKKERGKGGWGRRGRGRRGGNYDVFQKSINLRGKKKIKIPKIADDVFLFAIRN